LWDNLKGKVYRKNPCNAEALQNETGNVIALITADELQHAAIPLMM
jgi:hypothetical protein